MKFRKTEQQVRSLYLKYLQGEIVNSIYKKTVEAQDKAIMNVLAMQQAKTYSACRSFIYKSKVYPYNAYFERTLTKPLHSSLHDTMEKILKIDTDQEEIRIAVKTIIGNALIILRHECDLPKLLKADLAAMLPYSLFKPEILNIGVPLTNDQINQFHEQNALQFKAVAHLFLMRILLQEVE